MGRVAASPRVSVYMPVHNGEPFLSAAIESVLSQTLTDLELVIVENGSTDGSLETVRRAAADPRVRLIEYPHALGIVAAANTAITAARAALVARHDQDDLSHSRRLELQVRALEKSPDAVAVGTLSDGIDAQGRRIRPRDRSRLLRRSPVPPFPHGSVCLRREAFVNVGCYREGTFLWEDVDLFLRLARVGTLLVLPHALYRYRYHPNSVTAIQPASERAVASELMDRCIQAYRRDDDWSCLLQEPRREDATPAPESRHRPHDPSLWTGTDGPELDRSGRSLRQGWRRRSPRTLRLAIRGAVRTRDLLATPLVARRSAVRWQPR